MIVFKSQLSCIGYHTKKLCDNQNNVVLFTVKKNYFIYLVAKSKGIPQTKTKTRPQNQDNTKLW